MFKLLRYYSITSLVTTASAAVLLGLLYQRIAVSDLIVLKESENVALTYAFANSLWPKFASLAAPTSKLSAEQLRALPKTRELQEIVRAHMRGSLVVKVKAYNLSGMTLFSTEPRQIGEDKSANAGFRSARSGKVASELTHRNQFSAFEQILGDRDLISSYIPIKNAATGSIEAVFEIYSDVTPFLKKIGQTSRNIYTVVALILGLLYALLFAVVRRADKIIRRQHADLQRVDEGIRELNDGLERRVAQRTEQLVIANSELQRIGTVKDEFLAIMSHELRTPLTVAMGHTKLLKDGTHGQASPQQTVAIEAVADACAELARMIDNILQATRIEIGDLKLDKENLELGVFLDKLRQEYSGLSTKKPALHWDYPSQPQRTQTDPAKLKHILQCLIDNAIKFTPKGSVTITAKIDESGRRMIFTVADTGIGIAKEHHDSLFELFQQTDNSQTRVYRGAGLGLFIAKKYAEFLGGSLKVDSELGKGSTLTLAIPCR